MAVAYQSIGTATVAYDTANAITIPKPTGLAVGDEMIMIVGYGDPSLPTPSTPSGWTQILSTIQGTAALISYRKTATSGDVAASDFTLSFTGGSGNTRFLSGSILRISGQGVGSEIGASEGDISTSTNATINYTLTSTPFTSDSLVIVAFAGNDGSLAGTPTITSYTLTPSVTLTERADLGLFNSPLGQWFGVATGSYSGTSQFTQSTIVLNEAPDNNQVHQFIIVTPQKDVTGDISHLAITPTIESVTASQVNIVADASHLAITPTLNGIESHATSPTQWTNQTKPTNSVINNQNKP